MFFDTMTAQNQINFLQRHILVHSYIYHECNSVVIPDKIYDDRKRELVRLRLEYPSEWKNSAYYKQFGDDYNGGGGATLYSKLDEKQQAKIRNVANTLLQRY